MDFGSVLGGGAAKGILGITGSLFAKGIQKEKNKTTRLVSEINSERVAREVRYQEGLAAVGNAGSGNTQLGSFLMVAADNARQGQEKIEAELLKGEQAIIKQEASLPSPFEGVTDFVGSVASGIANRSVSNFRPS